MREFAYLTPKDLYDQGILDRTKVGEDTAWDLILSAQNNIELITRQWFNSRLLDINLDGNDSAILFLGVPVIDLNSLYLNEDESVLDPEQYIVHNSASFPDNRRNPRIELRRSRRSIFLGVSRHSYFLKGYMQRLVGRFGFVEPTGDTPALIMKALKRLVSKANSEGAFTGQWSASSTGPIKQEVTDGHSITYATQAGGTFNHPDSTGDREVDQILANFRGPLAIGVPRHKWPSQISYIRSES